MKIIFYICHLVTDSPKTQFKIFFKTKMKIPIKIIYKTMPDFNVYIN